MVLLRFTALFATLAVGVLALEGKSKTDTSDEMWNTFVQENEALTKKGLSFMAFPDLSKETYDHFISEALMIKGMKVYVFEHDFKTILTREGNWKVRNREAQRQWHSIDHSPSFSPLPQACQKAVKDAQTLVKDTTIYPYLLITMGLLQGWDETTGRLAGACQTFWVSTDRSAALLALLTLPLL